MALVSKFRGLRLTLTTASTRYNLYTLAAAADATAPKKVRTLQLQNDPDNASCKIFVGGQDLTSSVYGTKLLNGDANNLGNGEWSNIDLRDIYVLSDTDAVYLGVLLLEA